MGGLQGESARNQCKGKQGVDLTTTLILFCGSLGMFGFASWRANRPVAFGKVRMIPWTTLIIVFAVIAIFMLVHLVNLAGFKTGRP
jgi:hypothetical protein